METMEAQVEKMGAQEGWSEEAVPNSGVMSFCLVRPSAINLPDV